LLSRRIRIGVIQAEEEEEEEEEGLEDGMMVV
jgi:hypothetical protein